MPKNKGYKKVASIGTRRPKGKPPTGSPRKKSSKKKRAA